jgi:hypothetical protein
MTTIFVPARFKERVVAMPEITHVATEETLGQCYTIPVWGYLAVVSPNVDVRQLFGTRSCYDSFTTEEKIAALFVAPLTSDEREGLSTQIHLELGPTSEFSKDSAVAALTQMMKFLEPIALSQDCMVTLHVTNEAAFEPLYDGDLHIVLSSRPPGQTSDQRIIVLDDILLSSKPGGEKCPGPTKGRGFAIDFDGDFTIGQIVASNLYLFLPTGKESRASFAHKHDNPFRVALACVWQEYLALQKEIIIPEVQITSYEVFAEHSANHTIEALVYENQQEEIRNLQQLADRLRRELTLVHSQLQIQLAVAKALKKEPMTIDLLPFWEQLQNHPSIERITVSDDATLHYHTTPVYIEDENGALRDVGSFVIRVSDFDVHIWSTRITHPKGISHPHIASNENSICFGNVSSEIAKLCAESRDAEAVLLCLRWLTEGYEPTLTYHMIEEWPLVTNEATKELVDAKLLTPSRLI